MKKANENTGKDKNQMWKEAILDLLKEADYITKYYNESLDVLPGGLFVFDRNNNLIIINKKALELSEEKLENILNKNIRDIDLPDFHIDGKPFSMSTIEKTLGKGAGHNKISFLGKINQDEHILSFTTLKINEPKASKPKQEEVELTDYKPPDKQKADNIMCTAIYVEDITKEILLKKEVLKNRVAGNICETASNVVHEIRNPIQSISGIMQLIQKKWSDNKSLMKYIEVVADELVNIEEVLKVFLTYSKINDVNFRVSNLNQICYNTYILIKSNAILAGIDLSNDFAENMPEMPLDIKK